MTLLIDEALVRRHSDMSEMVAAIEDGLREEGRGELVMPPRTNIPMRYGQLRMMPVVMNGRGLFGFKAFHTSQTGARYLVAVYEQASGELVALVDGDFLTTVRTGATAGVGAKHLARADATSVGVIGAGAEARTNLAAMCAVRPVETVRVFSPRATSRETFAREMAAQHGLRVEPVDTPQAAVAGADIVVVATNTMHAPDPIAFRGAWAEPGMHVSSIGSTMPILREIDAETFGRADRLVVDAPEQMEGESGDVIAALEAGTYGPPTWLTDVATGAARGRESDTEITLFKSVGTAMQDVVAAFVVADRARREGGVPSTDLLHLKAFEQATATFIEQQQEETHV